MGIKRNKPPVKCRGTKAMNKNNWKPFSLHHIMYSMTPPYPKIVPIWLEFQSLNPYKRIRLNQIQKKKPHIWYNKKKKAKEKTDLERVRLSKKNPQPKHPKLQFLLSKRSPFCSSHICCFLQVQREVLK